MYYLHYAVRKLGFRITIDGNNKTIWVPATPKHIEAAHASRQLKELANKHNYGIQFTIYNLQND